MQTKQPLQRLLLVGFLVVATQSVASAEAWRFMVAGDSRGNGKSEKVNTQILGEIAVQAITQEVNFILVPGDLVTGYTQKPKQLRQQLQLWRDTMEPVYKAGIAVLPVRGNHDFCKQKGSKGGIKVWNQIFSGKYQLPQDGPKGEKNLTWSYTYGQGDSKALVLGLDMYNPKDHTINQAWVDAKLKETNAKHLFVMGHEPAFQVKHKDCLDDAPAARNRFIHSLIKAGGRSYFCGHDHCYSHLRLDNGDGNVKNDFHQFVVGTAGAPMYGEGKYGGNTGDWKPTKDSDGDGKTAPGAFAKEFGYMLVEIDGPKVKMTWWHRTGKNTYKPTKEVFAYEVKK